MRSAYEIEAVRDLWRAKANSERERDGNRFAQDRAEKFDRLADSFEVLLQKAVSLQDALKGEFDAC
jgi:hypothetical protein